MSLPKKVNDESTSNDHGQQQQQQLNDSSENTCVVCFKNVEIFSIGECDHPVCYECSTRMRVLCQQNECPICRQGLSKVIFTEDKRPYRELEANNRSEYYNKKYKICFANLQIQKAFYELLDHPCPKCDCRPFRCFDALKDHVRKEHEMFYCEICTEHLKIFSFERKCYTRQELALHRRKGDPDNTSHRGHPLCQYCDHRYVDRDELFRHLRREHYFCYFCDADGSNQFYSDYDSLREHFRAEHYLCEEGECMQEQFTSVFRTDIDLKAHIANVHGKSLGKLQAKQARTLQLDITIGPRGRSAQQEQSIASLRSRGNEELHEMDMAGASGYINQNPPRIIDAQSEQEFPCLGGASSNASTVTLLRPTTSIRTKTYGPAGLARTKENFPALGSGSGEGGGSYDGVNNSKCNQPPVSAVLKNTSSQQKAGSGGSSMVIHVSNRPSSATNSNAGNTNSPYQKNFPALPGTSKNQANLREDFIPANPVNLNAMSAKHRLLVDDYVSYSNPQQHSKITLVPKESINKTTKKAEQQSKNIPKLTQNDFPALTQAAVAPEVTWVKSQKQQEAENRKSKVAPPPQLNNFENLNKRNQEKKEQAKQAKSSTDLDSNINQSKRDKKQGKMDNDVKKSDSVSKNDNKSSNKSTKEKRVDNENENKNNEINYNGNKNKNNEKNLNGNNFVNNFDFPELESSRSAGPPPGFENKINSTKPPPGFQQVTLNSVAKPKNSITFTTSLGESYSIYPNHKYLPPPNNVKRNQELVAHFQNALTSPEAVEEFRHISQKFREGQYKALPYYEHCQAALGEKFDEIFPELLVLLPDINKQQELYLVYSQHLKERSKNKKLQKSQYARMEVCNTCKQVLKPSDLKAHAKSHVMDSNFPVLQDVDNLISSNRRK